MHTPSTRVILIGGGPQYLLDDTMAGTIAAGSVNGTLSTPGPGGRRLIRDVESKISISGGAAQFAAQATPNYVEEDLVYDQLPITRAFGVVIICKWRLTTDNPHYPLALVTSTTPTWTGASSVVAGFWRSAALTLSAAYSNIAIAIATIAVDTDYLLAIELRANGAIWKIKGGAFTNWMTLFMHTLDSTATLYVAAAGFSAVFALDDVRVPSRLFQDAPLASDSFAGTDGTMDGRLTDGLGHAEANGGAGLAWTGPTWTIASNAAVNTPTQGADLLTDGAVENWASATDLTSWTEQIAGTSTVNKETTDIHGGSNAARMDVDASNNVAGIYQFITAPLGSWLFTSWWAKSSPTGKTCRLDVGANVGAFQSLTVTYTQLFQATRCLAANPAMGPYRQSATSSSIYHDDIVSKILTLSTLFSSLTLATVNIMADCVIKTLVTGTQAGFVARLDSAASPANFVNGYWDGAGDIRVDECVAGVYTNLLNVTKAYATGDTIRPWLNASAWRLYHITAAGVVTLLGSGVTSVLTGNLFGNFSTYNGNAIESCVAQATGTENQYGGIDLL